MAVVGSDTYTDTAATTLASHTATLGGPWVAHTTSAGLAEITDANRLRNSSSATALYYLTVDPVSADQYASCDVSRLTLVNAQAVGPCVRMDTTAATFYHVRYNAQSAQIQLYKSIATTLTSLATAPTTGAGGAPTQFIVADGSTFNLGLSAFGTTLVVTQDGQVRITLTGQTDISAAGRCGVRLGGAAVTNSTGAHMDNFSVADAPFVVRGGKNLLLGVG